MEQIKDKDYELIVTKSEGKTNIDLKISLNDNVSWQKLIMSFQDLFYYLEKINNLNGEEQSCTVTTKNVCSTTEH